MKRIIGIPLVIVLVLGLGITMLSVQVAMAQTTIHVDASNTSDPLEDGSASHPFDKTQEGIDGAIAAGGGTVNVAAGLYAESIVISGEDDISLTIIGSGRENTILQQLDEGSTTVIISAAFSVTIEDMSIINIEGRALEIDGSNPTISNCYIEGLSFDKWQWYPWKSTAIFSHGSPEKHIYPKIINCTLKGAGYLGGGMTNIYSSPKVEGCVFLPVVDGTGSPVQNAFIGGGMYNENSSPTVMNCDFQGTWAIYGGGIYNLASSPIVEGCSFNNTGGFIIFDNPLGGWDVLGNGGGMYNSNSSPIVTDCSFLGTGVVMSAGKYGGGMYNSYSSPIVTDCSFLGTTALEKGGGMYNSNSSPEVTNCLFHNNMAQYGGGMYSYSYPDYEGPPPKVTKSSFIGCEAFCPKPSGDYPPPMGVGGNGGGMYNLDCSPEVINCTFVGNYANVTTPGGYGGGMYNENSSPEVINCTFRWNYALLGGGLFNDETSSPVITNSILWENFNLEGCEYWPCDFTCNGQVYSGTPIVTYSNVQLCDYTNDGNIDADPRFLVSEFLNENQDDWFIAHQLQYGSPCINAGNDLAVPEWLTTDLEGDPRIFNGIVDMGADEYVPEGGLVAAAVDIDPNTLNLKSKGKWITAYIEMPSGYDVADIDVATVMLDDTIPAEYRPSQLGDRDQNGIPDLMLKFNRQALIAYLEGSTGNVTLVVTGEVSGIPFESDDTIRVIKKGRK